MLPLGREEGGTTAAETILEKGGIITKSKKSSISISVGVASMVLSIVRMLSDVVESAHDLTPGGGLSSIGSGNIGLIGGNIGGIIGGGLTVEDVENCVAVEVHAEPPKKGMHISLIHVDTDLAHDTFYSEEPAKVTDEHRMKEREMNGKSREDIAYDPFKEKSEESVIGAPNKEIHGSVEVRP